MNKSLANQLQYYRKLQGFSQNDVANKLNLSRQSVSKWENGHTYPDFDNLLLLSELYQVSVDELLQENKKLKKEIYKNNTEIKETKKKLKFINKKINTDIKDESLFLLILSGISSFIFPLGLILAVISILKNKKSNSYYILVYVISIFAILLNLYDGYIHIANYMNWGNTTIEQIK
ncbi:MAG: helix-turn-helix transcriptional regulator [Enterococcus sp.]|nr:helix-turn-helix transcriptional regulator [Enterococcus sp.]